MEAIDNLIYPMTFVEINSDAFVDQGVNRGDVVFVAGTRAVPITEEDPYTQRVKMFVHKTGDGTFLINYTGGLYLMDPLSLKNLSRVEHDVYWDINFPEDKEEEAV